MVTNVIMKRNLFGKEISQNTKNSFFSVSDLVKAGNNWRAVNGLELFNLKNWLLSKSSKEFIESLEKKYGKVKINSRGKGSHTWVHPLLFIDIALAISPELKIEVYEWLFDELIKARSLSGDSYKKMCGYLYSNYSNKRNFPMYISDVAKKIQLACNLKNGDWQTATEEQLKLRDKIQDNISLLADILRDTDQAVKLGILKTKGLING